MKKGIHPKYGEVTATCSCGNIMNIKSTINQNFNVDVCGKCHLFYTGKQRNAVSGGRVERFQQKFTLPGIKKSKS